MTPELLSILLRLIWGDYPFDDASDALGINERTLRRWANGQNEIPDWLPERLMGATDALVDGPRSRNVAAARAVLAAIILGTPS